MLLALNLVHTQYLNPEHFSAPLPQEEDRGGQEEEDVKKPKTGVTQELAGFAFASY